MMMTLHATLILKHHKATKGQVNGAMYLWRDQDPYMGTVWKDPGCSREETLAFVPVNLIPKAPFQLVTLGVPRLRRHRSFDSGFTQTNHCTPSDAGNG